VQKKLNLGTREVVFPALKSGELSVIPEYTGALLGYLVKGKTKATKEKKVLSDLRSHMPKGVVALEPSSAQDKDALVVTQETAKKYHLKTISDLKGVAPKLVVGGPPELKTRFIGLPGLKKVYGVHFKSFTPLDAGGPLTKSALKNGDIQVARLFTTDASIAKNNWVTLRDDKDLIPTQNLIPVIRKDAKNPTVTKALNTLSSKLTTENVTRLNAKVQIDKQDPAKVAKQWLNQQGLLK
jgi:osmoprotectant transport system substrate-binding protein